MNPLHAPPPIRRPAQRTGIAALSFRSERIWRNITDRPGRSMMIVLAVAIGVGLAIAIIAASSGIQTKVNTLIQPAANGAFPPGDAGAPANASGGIDINTIHDVLVQTRDLLTRLAIGFTAMLVGIVTWVTMGQRRREIAIDRRQGEHRSDIIVGLLGETLLLCIVGGVVGIVFGYLLCAILGAQVPLLPLQPTPDGIIAIFPWTTLLSFAATAAVATFYAARPDADVSY